MCMSMCDVLLSSGLYSFTARCSVPADSSAGFDWGEERSYRHRQKGESCDVLCVWLIIGAFTRHTYIVVISHASIWPCGCWMLCDAMWSDGLWLWHDDTCGYFIRCDIMVCRVVWMTCYDDYKVPPWLPSGIAMWLCTCATESWV